jgi:hypothetical protein
MKRSICKSFIKVVRLSTAVDPLLPPLRQTPVQKFFEGLILYSQPAFAALCILYGVYHIGARHTQLESELKTEREVRQLELKAEREVRQSEREVRQSEKDALQSEKVALEKVLESEKKRLETMMECLVRVKDAEIRELRSQLGSRKKWW